MMKNADIAIVGGSLTGAATALAAAAALAAGCDVILHCNGRLDDMQQIAAASGVLSPEGQRRALAALYRRCDP